MIIIENIILELVPINRIPLDLELIQMIIFVQYVILIKHILINDMTDLCGIEMIKMEYYVENVLERQEN